MCSLGARCFMKLGRHEDAYEMCKIAVSPEQKTEKKTTLVSCHIMLGQVAILREHLDEADGHFAHALEEAKLKLSQTAFRSTEIFASGVGVTGVTIRTTRTIRRHRYLRYLRYRPGWDTLSAASMC